MYTHIVSLSGGMDSATVLGMLAEKYPSDSILAVGFSYGSKHNEWENRAAEMVAGYFGSIQYRQIDLYPVMGGFASDLLKSGGDIPEGHYEADSMKRTVVPGRNTIFAAILLGIAQSEGAHSVWLGVHAGDHHIYPDCRPEYIHTLAKLMNYASEGKINLFTPFIYNTKSEIIRRGNKLSPSVPYHLTRTCYKDQEIACGKCGSCQERLEAFAKCGIEDPIPYESRILLPRGN